MKQRFTLFCFIAASTAMAGTLSSLTSDGSLGDFGAYLSSHSYDGTNFFLNTDTGNLIAGEYNPYYRTIFGYGVGTLAPTTVATSNGTVSVFNFTSFSLPQSDTLTLYGSAPAAILSNGDVTIASSLEVWSNAGQNGVGGSSYFSNVPGTSGGNAGGGGAGGNGVGYVGANEYGTGGSGGGGGLVTGGGNGQAGVPQVVSDGHGGYYTAQGGAGAGGAAQNLTILAGGGGGGGGGGCIVYCTDAGLRGGNGGGAVFFGTPGNFTITSTGSINADGEAGGSISYSDAGPGGGGAGGSLWFDAGGTWTNDGTVSARGGAGGIGFHEGPADLTVYGGFGSGGYVTIDPPDIVNNGLIGVTDGTGGNGGLVSLDGPLSGSGQIEGSEAPEPGSLALLLFPAALLLFRKARQAL